MSTEKEPSNLINTTHSQQARLRPVPMNAVRLDAGFWSGWLEINRTKTLPFQHQFLESTGRLDNIRRAARRLAQPFRGTFYDESDVYKWLEAAYWTLGRSNDPGLLNRVDSIVKDLVVAQRTDGYLNTYFVEELAGERWTDLKDMHELYCAGHLMQAGIAGKRAIGDDRLLGVAIRFADHICDVFGPGGLEGTGGHPGIEMALVELFRETGERRYLQQAIYFLDQRGYGKIGGQKYHQDHKPFQDLEKLAGHAVRALYLSAGAADLVLETGNPTLLRSLENLWEQMTSRQMYISGGVGGRAHGEAFGEDYELPNVEAYAESCAAIANLMWNWRMFQIDAQGKYADLMETILYNGFMVGIGADGCGYFYRNPLASSGIIERAPWYSCACCPPNLARTLAALPGLIYSRSEDGVWINLYESSSVELHGINGADVKLNMQTDYPWSGEVNLEVSGDGDFGINLRIPHWVGGEATVAVNNEQLEKNPKPGEYFEIRRIWTAGDQIHLDLPMKPRLSLSHPAVTANQGRVALRRGPLLYCLEAVDNPTIDPNGLMLRKDPEIEARFDPDTLGGVTVLEGNGEIAFVVDDWEQKLYRDLDHIGEFAREPVQWTAVPYFAWANRGIGWMQVWVRSEAL